MGFESPEEKERREKMKRILEERGIVAVPPKVLRSIEELAKLSREIEGLGLGYLSRSQIKWLYSGGFDVYKETKPLIYNLLIEMEKVGGVFPVNLKNIAEIVQRKIRKKAREGVIDGRWKKVTVSPSEIDTILRFKRDPYFSKEEKTKLMAETLVEVLEEMYQKEKKRHKIEEPEVKVALEVARKWLERFRRARGEISPSSETRKN